MKPLCLNETFRLAEYGLAALSLFLNSILFLLILLKTKRELQVYSRVLLSNCVTETLFTLCSVLVEYHLDFRNGLFYATVNGFAVDSWAGNAAMTEVFLFSFYVTMVMGLVPFVYRYQLLCRDHTMSYGQFALLLLAVCLLASGVPCAVALFYLPTTERISNGDVGLVETLTCEVKGMVPYFLGKDSLSFPAVFPIGVGALSVSVTYTIILFCTYKIWRMINSSATMSQRSRSLQQQLSYALYVQASMPLIVVAVPMCFAFQAALTGSESAFLPWLTTILSFIPVLNPIATIYFVKSYRNAIIKIFMRPCPSMKCWTTSGSVSSSAGEGNNRKIQPITNATPWSVSTQ
ncbi:7TM GPCR protein [Aphelenchoides avenae]|nr:7TM GPCR protein [Aphelenchus avenae]